MPPKSSLAMVQTGPRKIERMDLPVPDITDYTALLRIEACGICGSDYEQYEGVLNMPMPVVPGHEPLGVIEAIGDEAAKRVVDSYPKKTPAAAAELDRYHFFDSMIIIQNLAT